MRYCELGTTGIRVSAVSMGCWALAGDATWGPQDDADSVATVHAALDAGVSLFDTAEGYGAGDSESMLGRALAGRRDQAVIATKVSRSNLSAESVRQACEDSLRRLRTDYVDLYQVHWPSRSVPLEETLEALDRLHAEGKIRALGVCNFGPADLSDLLARRPPAADTPLVVRASAPPTGAKPPLPHIVTNQLPYSLLWRAIEHEIQPMCVDNGIGILCYSPLAQGLLTGKFAAPDDVPAGRARTRLFSGDRPEARHGEPGCEAAAFVALAGIRRVADALGQPMAAVAVAWLLHRPGVTSVIAGARRPDQIEQTAAAADLALTPAALEELDRATREVKRCAGPNPDMWASASRFR